MFTSKSILWSLFLILGWYGTSISLGVYNKWLFSEKHHNFRFPMFTSAIQQAIQYLITWIVFHFYTDLRPKRKLSQREYATILPCAITTGLDIGFSNASLKTITLTFYTMVKSGAPVFVLLFAFLFRLEKPSVKLAFIIFVICLGVFIMVHGDTQFDLYGYLLVQTATVLSGLRWSLTQVLLGKESHGLDNPVATIHVLAPMITLTFLGCFFVFEDGMSALVIEMSKNTLGLLSIISGGGVLAFIMIVFEYALISHTSVVTLSVAGIFKEIVTLVTGHFVFQDNFTTNTLVGLVCSLVGIIMYNYVKLTQKKHQSEEFEFQELRDEDWDEDFS
ncbi:TPT-domain-containing protein [Gorgonomyces haynaldii]|nr:TPT-domain-containing protein [Gorgonomyces haynaldii]